MSVIRWTDNREPAVDEPFLFWGATISLISMTVLSIVLSFWSLPIGLVCASTMATGHLQILPGAGAGVGPGDKFVLLDMTEEPEAKKLTVYNTNEI